MGKIPSQDGTRDSGKVDFLVKKALKNSVFRPF